MNVVWKFPLSGVDLSYVEMPERARIIHVGIQGDTPTLWAWVDPSAPKVERRFGIVGTGHPAPSFDAAVHLGSIFDGPFVWHVFEVHPI